MHKSIPLLFHAWPSLGCVMCVLQALYDGLNAISHISRYNSFFFMELLTSCECFHVAGCRVSRVHELFSFVIVFVFYTCIKQNMDTATGFS